MVSLKENQRLEKDHPSKKGQGLPVIIQSNSNGLDFRKKTTGSIQVQFWNKKERIRRAVKYLAMCWGLALCSVIFPLVHFVLVPGFLIAGPIVAIFTLDQESIVLGGDGICPACDKHLAIVRTAYRFPIMDVCSACRHGLKIMPADISAQSGAGHSV